MFDQFTHHCCIRPAGWAVLALVICIGGVLAQESDESSTFDPSQICGEWKYIDGTRAGVSASDENMAGDVAISEKEFTLGAEGNTFVIAYKLNTKVEPVEIDMEITSGPAPPNTKAIGILKVADGRLTLCYDPSGGRRPTTFESTEENGCHLFELAKRPFDSDRIVGKWTYESGERAGAKIEAERLQGVVTISKDKFVVPAGPDAEFVMSYKLEVGQYPVGIDLSIESGPAPEGKALGIIKFQDGKLYFCYDPTGANRPAEFATSAEDGRFFFILNRQPDPTEKKDEPETKPSGSSPKQ